MKIGLVDLDTSHPKSWLPIHRELGHEVVGVWDGGAVHPAGYAETFAKENGIPSVFGSLEEMARSVDCAILHGCDWDTHVDKARPFASAGKAILVDKPIAGKLKDLRQMLSWARSGIRISGGSSLRFCFEARDYLALPEEERGKPHTVVAGCGVDEFNYGIHAYSLLSGILGQGISRVKDLGGENLRRVEVRWEDGRMGLVLVPVKGGYVPFHATLISDRAVHHIKPEAGSLYRGELERVLPYLSGQAPDPPVPFEALIEPELAALAARQSGLNHGQEVRLADLSEEDPGFDGAAFALEYKNAKYGG
ncbi:MAG: Gfo/Idh/MocA family oxidoreductase [Candidatus Omnitrophica bacterium]|nr:hypothetical protein [bacterium]NUN97699.1 Gfo/Idh/MocA family oxidoreductase [Candidatus Omnitrophota bacterium]